MDRYGLGFVRQNQDLQDLDDAIHHFMDTALKPV